MTSCSSSTYLSMTFTMADFGLVCSICQLCVYGGMKALQASKTTTAEYRES